MAKNTNRKKPHTDREGPAGFRDRWAQSTLVGGPGQKWTLWASIGLITVVVGGALVVLFLPQPNEVPSAPAVTAGSGPRTDQSAGDGVCPAGGEHPDRVEPPTDLDWGGAYGNSWPVSSTTGPVTNVDGVGRCFERSPVGAALAAVNYTTSMRAEDLEVAHRILDAGFVDNPGRAAAAAGIDRVYPDQPPQTRPVARQMGYTILNYTSELVQVRLVEFWPGADQYTGQMITLVWEGGDWKVALQPDGQLSPDGPITVDPDGFTRWQETQ